jgi:hypothetical protein
MNDVRIDQFSRLRRSTSRACNTLLACAIALLSLVISSPSASAALGQLRVVVWNTASDGENNAPSTPRTGFEAIMQAIGQENVNGIARPADLLCLQEQSLVPGPTGASITTENIVSRLKALYGAGTYAAVPKLGGSIGGGTQALVYRTASLSVVADKSFGTISSTVQPRQELRYQLRPHGSIGSEDFYVYVGHWKADSDSTSANRRDIEAKALRADAVALGADARILYTGDFNLYNSSESAWTDLTAAGTGQAIDPANRVGSWHKNAGFASIFTQAPAVNPPGTLVGGGLDDRFDFQVATAPVITGDDHGLKYIAGSYHSFGNNGTVPVAGNIYDLNNTALADFPDRKTLLNDLASVSDHLPVVADYTYDAGIFADEVLVPSSVPEPGACAIFLLASTGAMLTRAANRFRRGRHSCLP